MPTVQSVNWSAAGPSEIRERSLTWLRDAYEMLRRDSQSSQNGQALAAVNAALNDAARLTTDSDAAEVQNSAQRYLELYEYALAHDTLARFIHAAFPIDVVLPIVDAGRNVPEMVLTPDTWSQLRAQARNLLPNGDDLRGEVERLAQAYDDASAQTIPDAYVMTRLRRYAAALRERLRRIQRTRDTTNPTPPNEQNATVQQARSGGVPPIIIGLLAAWGLSKASKGRRGKLRFF